MQKIHRDIKGGNILLTESGQAKLGNKQSSIFSSIQRAHHRYSWLWCLGHIDAHIFQT